MTGDDVVRLLAEPARLRVFAAVVLGSETPADLATVTGLATRDVLTGLRKLADGGLVEFDGRRATAAGQVFGDLARQAAIVPPREDFGYADERVTTVLRTFVRDGRLLGMPAQRSSRLVVLDHVAQAFEPGVSYSESEVDVTLVTWTEGSGVDHVSVRRYLVDEDLLSRVDGVYRRSGGSTDVSA